MKYRPATHLYDVTKKNPPTQILSEEKSKSVTIEHKDLLAAIIESADDAIISKTLDGTILSWNSSAARIFGYTSEEAIGRHISLIIPAHHMSEEKEILNRIKEGRRIQQLETVRKNKDGVMFPVSLTISPVKDSSGRIVGASKIARELSSQRHAQLELNRERELTEALFDKIPVMLTIYRPDIEVLKLNPEFERLIGWSTDEAKSLSIMEECYPDAEYRQKIARFMESCSGWMDITMRGRDGSFIETTWANVKLSDNRRVGIGLDITERKKTEKALADRARQLEVLYKFTDCLYRSDTLEAVYDCALDSIIPATGCDRAAILLFDDNDEMRFVSSVGLSESYQRSVEGHSPWGNEEVAPRPISINDITQSDIPEALKKVVIKEGIRALSFIPLLADGGLIGKFMIYYDKPHEFTEDELGLSLTIGYQLAFGIQRVRTELERKEVEERLRIATHAGKVGIWDWDISSDTVAWTDSMYDIFGIPNGAFDGTGDGVIRLIHEEDAPKVEAEVDRALSEGATYEIEFRTISKKGGITWIYTNGTVVRDESGQPVRMIGAAVDITERRQAEQRLIEADRRKNEFLATLAHELRNPLAPVRNALELLKRSGNCPEVLASARTMMERQVSHMAHLIDDLMDAGRITCGKLVLRKEKVNLIEILREAVNVSRQIYGDKLQDIRISVPAGPLFVDGDPVRLEQTVGNLLNNACKYTHTGGAIEVSAVREGSEVLISVKDNGVGISEKMLPVVFDLFTQADSSLDRAAGGLGIGLSLVQGLVKLHGGSVSALSDGPGKGSEFVIRLPAIAEEATAKKQSARPDVDEQLAAGARRILVVDDNVDAAETLAMLLELEGHKTCVAYDGQEAVQLASSFSPDAVLLDIGLPKLNGFEACREIRKQLQGREPTMIAITGWGQEEDRRKSQEAGFDGHLVKPLEYDDLMRLLEQ